MTAPVAPASLTDTASPVPDALAAWRDALGTAHVITDAAALRAAGTATFDIHHPVTAILRPGSTAEVRECMRIATRFRTLVHPVSAGCNWGFGSRVPSVPGCTLIDLSRMNRIADFSETLAYATVEPGVTFAQMHAFLEARGSALYASATGGPPHASLIGNAMERGDGDGPSGDRSNHIAGLEVVLADGRVVQTGFARFPGARSAPLHGHGVGAGVEQLFVQSNLGIVTRMSVPLARRPDHTLAWCATVGRMPALAPLLDALRALIQRGVMRPNAIAVWNGWKLLAREHVRTDPAVTHEAGNQWWCSGLLEALDADHLALLQTHATRHVHGHVTDIRWSAPNELMPGRPGEGNLHTMYWARPANAPRTLDPDRDRCGLLWLCPALPFDGAIVVEALRIVDTVAAAWAFEPHVGLTALSERQAIAFVTLAWDRDAPGADARGRGCHDEMLERLIAAGHLPYRLGLQSMEALPPSMGAYPDLLRGIRSLCDRAGILSPGRYS